MHQRRFWQLTHLKALVEIHEMQAILNRHSSQNVSEQFAFSMIFFLKVAFFSFWLKVEFRRMSGLHI